MSEDLKKLVAEALRLPQEASALLAGRLVEALHAGNAERAEAQWGRELAIRMTELARGAIEAVPWADARRAVVGSDDDGRDP
jgi:hypothetical protein